MKKTLTINAPIQIIDMIATFYMMSKKHEWAMVAYLSLIKNKDVDSVIICEFNDKDGKTTHKITTV